MKRVRTEIICAIKFDMHWKDDNLKNPEKTQNMQTMIKEVASKSDLHKFIRFPLQLYKKHPYFVPTLISDDLTTLDAKKNPAFDYCEARYWLAYQGNKVVGRIAGIINRQHIDKWEQPYMRFGWIDFIDDLSVSKALIEKVEKWAKESQLKAIHGPLGFTNLDHEGMLIEGFDELGTMATIYNYPYYSTHLEKLGYQKDCDSVEFEIVVPKNIDPRISKAAEVVLRRNKLSFPRFTNKHKMLKFAPQIFGLINSEYAHLYGVTLLSDKQIEHYTNAYFGFLHPDFVPIILDENKDVVAFGVVIPSLSKALQKSRGRILPFGWYHLLRALRKNERADLYLIAVKKSLHGLGLSIVLMDHVAKVFNRRGIHLAESNPELKSNENIQSQWKFFNKRQHKRRRCFIKHL